jgi:hypothetical protein
MVQGIGVNFCWVPSHCGISSNETADLLARRGALQEHDFITSYVNVSQHEQVAVIEKYVRKKNDFNKVFKNIFTSRNLSALAFKLRLNSWKTKFSQNVTCACSLPISIDHLLFDCPLLNAAYVSKGLSIDRDKPVYDILHSQLLLDIVPVIYSFTVVNKLL